jgi:hypothetical protein
MGSSSVAGAGSMSGRRYRRWPEAVRDQDGLGLISLLASVVIIGLLSVVAVKSLGGLPTSATPKGTPAVVLPGGDVAVGGEGSTNDNGRGGPGGGFHE